MVDRDEETAYIYEAVSNEIKLGGCGLAIIALTEYMEAFDTDCYQDVCRKLGNGILTLLDQETGCYQHVLNPDYSLKEDFRTVYYDGEATFALVRLYRHTGEDKWLEAAKSAVDHFVAEDYTQYRDQWIAYSLNEITQYVDDSSYYLLALRNVGENYDRILTKYTAPVTFELLLTTFELYHRLVERGAEIEGFDQEKYLSAITEKAQRMLDGYFYPEYAMYMADPASVLGAFMVREDGFRTRIDDVQHSMVGFYLYAKNYETMLSYAK